MKFFIIIFFIYLFIYLINSCYTVVDKTSMRNENNIEDNSDENDYLIEGTVKYVTPHGGPRETNYPNGFILKDHIWFISLPTRSRETDYKIERLKDSMIA